MFHDLDLKVNVQAILENLEYDKERNSDDISEDAELVATHLHALQITEDGGDDEADGIDVYHIDRENNFRWS